MKINIAVSVSQRFECLNLFLDIIKNNFKEEYVTHVFCNLCEKDLDQFKDAIDFSLIDEFHHFPDECAMKQDTYSDREKHKRVQPLRLIKNTFSTMAGKESVNKFIYTECDVFPLVESNYTSFYEKITDKEIYASHNDRKDEKFPEGFILPSPLYLSKYSAERIANFIKEPIQPTGKSFEGRLMSVIKSLPLKVMQINEEFPNNFFNEKNRCRYTETSHQHNPLNLAKALKNAGITSGKWVNQVLTSDKLYELTSETFLVKQKNFEIKYWQ